MQEHVRQRIKKLLAKYRWLRYFSVGILTFPVGYGLQSFFVQFFGLTPGWAYTATGLVMMPVTFELNNVFTWREVPIYWPSKAWWWTFTKWCATRLPLLAGARFSSEALQRVLPWRLSSLATLLIFGAIGYLLAKFIVFAGKRRNGRLLTDTA